VTWNMVRRNIFNWKQEEIGQLESKVKSFCDRRHVLDLLKHFIVFAEKDEELNKYIMAQHQTRAVRRGCLIAAWTLGAPVGWSGTPRAAARPSP
jgi:type I restriction enzyme R subunit